MEMVHLGIHLIDCLGQGNGFMDISFTEEMAGGEGQEDTGLIGLNILKQINLYMVTMYKII